MFVPEYVRMVLLTLVATMTSATKRQEVSRLRPASYEHFDEYLISVAAPREFNLVLKPDIPTTTPRQEESGVTPPSDDTQTPEELASVDILGYFKDVPREHWSCCMLGKLAGDKGFHCHAEFYASRITTRNFNRAHNRRMPFHTEQRLSAANRATLRTFQRCVARDSEEFDKCCYSATVEREERSRWEMFRRLAQSDRVRLIES